MAGGPLHWTTAYPVTADIAAPLIYNGAGATEDREKMLGLADATTVTADVIVWHLKFEMYQVIPTGTAKLRIITRANATSGTIGLNIQTMSITGSESPDDGTRTDEASADITTPGTADQNKETLHTLTAGNVVADEFLHVYIEVDDTAHNIAADTGMAISVIWE